MCSSKKKSWVIPFGGNAFVTSHEESSSPTIITPCGVANWTSPSSVISVYFHSEYPAIVLAALRLSVPEGGSSLIALTVSQYDVANKDFKQVGETRSLDIQGSEFHLVNCGFFSIPAAGYVKLEINGVEKTGPYFASVTDALLVSESYSLLEDMTLRFVDEPEDFYFGRRGPSVHLAFPLQEFVETEYFYNEIYVPKDQDVIGCYFCAIGFSGGYFGIQVNSEEERRILFSVWSEYNTDDPSEIPEDYKVKLIRNGDGVYVGDFGSEGSGKQSYLQYLWQPETTYKFVVQGIPMDSERTMYTAWFNNGSGWILIASFEKPKVSTYFKGPYSFSENFIPDMGYVQRSCIFANQWACDAQGNWLEITKAKFTADATASKETRMDVSGGVEIDGNLSQFYLRNCGFFSDRVIPETEITRESSGLLPPVDVSLLP